MSVSSPDGVFERPKVADVLPPAFARTPEELNGIQGYNGQSGMPQSTFPSM